VQTWSSSAKVRIQTSALLYLPHGSQRLIVIIASIPSSSKDVTASNDSLGGQKLLAVDENAHLRHGVKVRRRERVRRLLKNST
jgi:hypothetical protein